MMKKLFESKTSALIQGGLSLLVILLLVASLDGLKFKPAEPFAFEQTGNTFSTGEIPSWNGFIIVIAVLVISLIILFILLPSQHRKKFLRVLAGLGLVGTIVYILLLRLGLENHLDPSQGEFSGIVRTLSTESTNSPKFLITPANFIPPQVSPLTSYLITLGLLLGIIGVWYVLIRRNRKKIAPFVELAEITLSARDEISAGKDLGNAILNSYLRMNIAVANWRGIHRSQGMTPSEFADFLVSVQLPSDAIHRLNLLFERVRYGQKITTALDIQEALDSLTIILDYCRAVK
jgi:hypothetical protein